MSRILVAEDEERIASFIKKGLESNGHTVTVVADGEHAATLGRSGDFDLVVLDIGLPRKDGFAVLQELRTAHPDLPVIILTARDSVEDTVAGLEGGADDYMAKPFRFVELLARIRARLRPSGTTNSTRLVAGGAELDLRTRTVHVEGREVELTAREFALAEVFFRHIGQVLSREQLLDQVWGLDHDPSSNVVDVYVGYLRRKLGEHRISTVRGMGYRFERVAASATGDDDADDHSSGGNGT